MMCIYIHIYISLYIYISLSGWYLIGFNGAIEGYISNHDYLDASEHVIYMGNIHKNGDNIIGIMGYIIIYHGKIMEYILNLT
jgi:hypothetical protein